MSTIKKAFQPVVSLLQANLSATVEDIIDEVIALTEAKTGAGGSKAQTFVKDDDGNTVAIRCYFYGVWMDPNVVEFGKKAGSASGYNSMCKEGQSLWNKAQAAYKKGKEQLLTDVASGDIDPSDVASALEALEAQRNERPECELPHADSAEELLA